MKSVKSNVHLAFEKAKHGGKKGAKAAAKGQKSAKQDIKEPENCVVFVAPEYPDWQKTVLEILSEFQFDE